MPSIFMCSEISDQRIVLFATGTEYDWKQRIKQSNVYVAFTRSDGSIQFQGIMQSIEDNTTILQKGGFIVQMKCLLKTLAIHFATFSTTATAVAVVVLIDSCNLTDTLQRRLKIETCYKKWKCTTNSFHACALAPTSPATHIYTHTPFFFTPLRSICICAWELEINPFADISLQSFELHFSPNAITFFVHFIERWLLSIRLHYPVKFVCTSSARFG